MSAPNESTESTESTDCSPSNRELDQDFQENTDFFNLRVKSPKDRVFINLEHPMILFVHLPVGRGTLKKNYNLY